MNLPPACSRVSTTSVAETPSSAWMSVGNAAAVVAHRHAAVAVQRQLDPCGEPGLRLIDGVVDDLEGHVVQAGAVIGVADIHARPLAHGVEAAEDGNRGGVVGVGLGRSARRHRSCRQGAPGLCGISKHIAIPRALPQGYHALATAKSASGSRLPSATRNASACPRKRRKASRSVPVRNDLRRQTQQGREQRRAAVGVEMHRRLVQQQQRREAARLRRAARHGRAPRRSAAPSAGRCWPARRAASRSASASAMSARWAPKAAVPAAASRARLAASPARSQSSTASAGTAGQALGDRAAQRDAGGREGGGGAGRQRRVEPCDQRGARSGHRDRMARHRILEAGEPGGIRAAGRQQPVAARHRRVVGADLARVRRFQRIHQPVEEAAAAGGPFLEQPVHLRRQPHRGDARRHLGLAARRRAVEAEDAPVGRSLRRRAGADVDLARGRGEPSRHGQAAARPRPRRARSAMRAPRSPRPGTSREIASSRLVLPLPFGPHSSAIRCDGRQVSAA